MNAPDRPLDLRINPDWAKLPLFDRSKWQRVRFGDVVDNINDTCDPAEVGIKRFIGLEHLEPGSLHIGAWGNVSDGTTFTRRCRSGQVLFGKRRAYQRKVAVAEFDAVVSGDIYVLAPKNKRLLRELLPYICISDRFFEFAVGTSAGSLSPRTNWSSLAAFEFALPPTDQQKRIAEILIAGDVCKVDTEILRKCTADYRTAFVTEMLAGFPEGSIRFRSIGGLVGARVIEPPQDGNHGELHPKAKDYLAVGVPFVMANDLQDGILDLVKCKRISEQRANRLRIGFARPGDVLLTHKGTIGLTAIVPSEVGAFAMLTPQVTYYRILDQSVLRTEFLLVAFRSDAFQRALQLRAKQSTRDYIGILAQHNLPISIPDIAVQDSILERLAELERPASALDLKIRAFSLVGKQLLDQVC